MMTRRYSEHNKAGFLSLVLLLQLALGFPSGLHAQEEADLELRGTYTIQSYLTRLNFIFRNDISFRSFFVTDPHTTFMVRPRAILEIGDILDIQPAFELRFTSSGNATNSFELRTWQGFNVHWPDIGRVMFDHLYRFEQRFFWSEGEREEGIGFRSRYRLNLRIPVNNSMLADNTYFIDLRGEIFIPHDDEIYEIYTSRMRFGAVFGYRRSIRWRFMLAGYFESGWNTLSDSRNVNHYIVEATVRTSL